MRKTTSALVLALALAVTGCSSTTPPAPAADRNGTAAKTAKPQKNSAAPANGSTAPGQPAAPPEAYSYQSGGRRDPFIDVLTGGPVTQRIETKRGEGLAGLLVNEITVRITVEMNGARVAMVQAPDGRSYNVRQGDKLADGTIKTITPEGLVIMQDVNDPLSTAKQREVRKLLRSLEEVKQ